MSQPRAVLLDVHDVLYDISQWRQWFSQSLRQIGVDVSFFAVWDFDPFPYSATLSNEYLFTLNRFLTDIGLNSGQKEEFCASARYQFGKWLNQANVFADVTETLRQIRQRRMNVGFVSAWHDSRPLPEFLTDLGLRFNPDTVFVHDNVRPSVRATFRLCGDSTRSEWSQLIFVSRSPQWLQLGSQLGMKCVGLDIPVPDAAEWQSISCLSEIHKLYLVEPLSRRRRVA